MSLRQISQRQVNGYFFYIKDELSSKKEKLQRNYTRDGELQQISEQNIVNKTKTPIKKIYFPNPTNKSKYGKS
jgi:hypothetical protein